MQKLSPKQTRIAVAGALALYVLVVAGTGAWLYLNRESTAQKRALQTPSVTVWLPGKEPKVPESWQEKKPEETKPAETAAAMPPPVSPEAASATPPASAAASEASKPEAPATAQATPEPAKPAEAAAAPAAPETAAPTIAKWQKNARPFDQQDTRPRIGLVVKDLGLFATTSDAAVQTLPANVDLAYSAFAPNIEALLAKARSANHETLLSIPMEPNNYPQNDPGPNTLLVSLPSKDNVSRLRMAMAKADGYVAIIPSMGEKFVTSEEKLSPVLDVVKDEGVMILDGTMNKDSLVATLSRLGKIPFARNDMVIDAASTTSLDDQLAELEKLAESNGHAIGVVLPYPAAFTAIKAWATTLDKKGVVLAPLTALASQDVAPPVAAPAPAATPIADKPVAPAAVVAKETK